MRLPSSFFYPSQCIVSCALSVLAAACGQPHDEDLQAWMRKARASVQPAPLPAPEPLITQAIRYDPGGRPDPFDVVKISAALNASPDNGPSPNLDRPREPLESYPMDSLRMVGSLRRRGQAVALIETGKLIYPVRKGNHLGQDQGKVISIDESTIEIEELVQETTGGWTRRLTRLSIQERK